MIEINNYLQFFKWYTEDAIQLEFASILSSYINAETNDIKVDEFQKALNNHFHLTTKNGKIVKILVRKTLTGIVIYPRFCGKLIKG